VLVFGVSLLVFVLRAAVVGDAVLHAVVIAVIAIVMVTVTITVTLTLTSIVTLKWNNDLFDRPALYSALDKECVVSPMCNTSHHYGNREQE
jgi:hypothetical protein